MLVSQLWPDEGSVYWNDWGIWLQHNKKWKMWNDLDARKYNPDCVHDVSHTTAVQVCCTRITADSCISKARNQSSVILHIDSCLELCCIVYLEEYKSHSSWLVVLNSLVWMCEFHAAKQTPWKSHFAPLEMLTHLSFLSQKNLFPSHYSQFLLISRNSSSLLSLWMMSSINRGWS